MICGAASGEDGGGVQDGVVWPVPASSLPCRPPCGCKPLARLLFLALLPCRPRLWASDTAYSFIESCADASQTITAEGLWTIDDVNTGVRVRRRVSMRVGSATGWC